MASCRWSEAGVASCFLLVLHSPCKEQAQKASGLQSFRFTQGSLEQLRAEVGVHLFAITLHQPDSVQGQHDVDRQAFA